MKTRRKRRFGFIVGPSGIGKEYGVGSIAREYFGACIFVSGDWCREHHNEHAARGVLVNDELIRGAAEEHYVNMDKPDFFLFDCPRSDGQAVAFIQMFQRWDPDATLVTLHISASEQVCIDRIKHRAHQKGRDDDANESTIRKRLSVYFGAGGIKERVIPILQKETKYRRIDGHESLEIIRTRVRDEIAPAVFE